MSKLIANNSLYDSIWDSIYDLVYSSIRNSVRDSLRNIAWGSIYYFNYSHYPSSNPQDPQKI